MIRHVYAGAVLMLLINIGKDTKDMMCGIAVTVIFKRAYNHCHIQNLKYFLLVLFQRGHSA